ncbi:MAG: hypothetical protein ACOC5D_05045 [Thermoplasmatota archaeon]
MNDKDRNDKLLGRYTGIIVFILGVILLIFTFYIVYQVFMNPDSLEGFSELAPSTSGEFGQIVQILIYFVGVLLLWVMGSIAGRIAKHGIDLWKPTEENVLHLESAEGLSGSPREREMLEKINRIGRTVDSQNDMIKKLYSEKNLEIPETESNTGSYDGSRKEDIGKKEFE